MPIQRLAAYAAGVLWTTAAAIAAAQGPLVQPGAFTPMAPAHPHSPMAAAGDYVDARGNPAVVPASYGAPGSYCGPAGCPPTGGYGPAVGYGMGGDPFGGASLNTEQCGPHYFDFSAEYLNYRRADTNVSNGIFSIQGNADDEGDPAILQPIPDSRIRLRTDDAVTDELNGFRLTGRFDVGALAVAEFSYSGLYSEDGEFGVSDSTTAGLFSVYSLYGAATNGTIGSVTPAPGDRDANGPPTRIDTLTPTPAAGAPTPRPAGEVFNPLGARFEETANAQFHGLTFESELQSVEASMRRYWLGYDPRVSGTVLIGFRYTSLEEAMGFRSVRTVAQDRDDTGADIPNQVTTRALDVTSTADNYLAGVQVGGDIWYTVVQGLRIGADGKLGLYGNDARLQSRVVASDGSPSGVTREESDVQVAFLTEARLSVVADLTPCWSLKAGYEVLFVENVALVEDGLAFAQPYGDINNIANELRTQPVTSGLNDGDMGGNVFYHGFHAGLEYVW